MYSPIRVANELIKIANNSGSPLTHMQIQKLLYIAHGFSLAFYDEPLLSDPVCAWKYGPVIPSVYSAFRQNGSNPITKVSSEMDSIPDLKTRSMIEQIYKTYGKLSGIQLSEFTHRSKTPWEQAWSKGNKIIDDNLIKEYYKKLINKDSSCHGL